MYKQIIAALIMLSSTYLYAPTYNQLSEQEQYEYQIARIALEINNIDFYYVYTSIIYYESGFKNNVINYNSDGTYDYGPAQLNSAYWFKNKKYWGHYTTNSVGNVIIGARYFLDLLKQTKFNFYRAVLAYNCGINRKVIPQVTYMYARKVFLRAISKKQKP